MEGLKQERFILPSADTLERAGLAGRARARKAAAALIVESLGHAELARIDDLIVNNSDFGMTPLAWLRNFEEAPTTANINGLLERLSYVRGIGIDPAIGAKIPDFRFAQFMREGGVAPAFLLSDYSLNRRRATLIAAVIDLDARLADGAIQMFDRLVGSLFTRARRGRERRYQDSIRSVGELMRLFGATIAALGEAVEHGGNPLELIDEAVGWHRLVAAKSQVDALAELAGEDALVAATGRYATLRRFSPAFLDTFTFKASGSGSQLVKAIEVIRDTNARKARSLPGRWMQPLGRAAEFHTANPAGARERLCSAAFQLAVRCIMLNCIPRPAIVVFKQAKVDPALCQHPNEQLKPKSNKKDDKGIDWFVCVGCACRWERMKLSDVEPKSQMFTDKDLVTFGDYLGKTYSDVWRDPVTAQHIIRTAEIEKSASPAVKRLAMYLVAREKQEGAWYPVPEPTLDTALEEDYL